MIGRLEKISPRSSLEGRETLLAIILTGIWMVLVLAYGAGYFGFLGDVAQPRDAAFLEVVFFLMALVLPMAMIWMGAALMRRSCQIQAEARALEARVRELQGGRGQNGVSQPRIKDNRVETLLARVGDMEKQIKHLETTITSIGQMQAAMQTQAAATQVQKSKQPDLPLEPAKTAEVPELDIATMIKALDFPRTEKDTKGFRALRIAKQNPEGDELLRAAEDIMNLLSQEGVYMDDLRPVISSTREWRLFAQGTRGPDVAAVGGIDAPEAFERINARKASDQIFRDAALFFLRRFDIMLRQFVENANDAEIQQLADTRSGRAFMLLARSAGMFD